MTREPWHGDRAQLEAAFEASLITGRIYLNIRGIAKNRHDLLVPFRPQDDDVSAHDLGGTLVETAGLAPADTALFVGFLKMADKGAAHLTMPNAPPGRGHAYRHRADLRTDQSASLRRNRPRFINLPRRVDPA